MAVKPLLAAVAVIAALAGCTRVGKDYTARMDGRTSASVVRAILAEVPVQNLGMPKTLKEAA